MTAERVSAEQHYVHREHERTDADAERLRAGRRIDEPERFPHVVGEDDEEDEGEVQEIAMHVLHDEREAALAEVALARLADRTGRWIGPERAIVGAAVVVAGEAEQAGRPEDQERR